MTDTHTFSRPSLSDGRGAGVPELGVSPTLGKAVTCPADVKAIMRRWGLDNPLPPPQLRAHIPAPEQVWQDEVRKAQLEDVLRELSITAELPWSVCQQVWAEAIRRARAVLTPANEQEGAAA